ncbi:toxin-activating lysine-acyltransferase [Maridesulfovibrio sp.]|uniref:toxin-activating lysine-acyltransferase n=1 Tax=Maridesulfovibrio sp. TaxID=2795000 RepID=UPI002A18A306|nr:toxin-activating lysine-acyltransferase [Maridesulfovibrio sp.]
MPEENNKNVVDSKDNVSHEVNTEANDAKASSQPDLSSVLGVVTALMMDSPVHEYFFLSDMKWLVVPPVRLRQFRIFRKDGMPFAYVCWASVNEQTEARLKAGHVKLRPDEWNNGDNLWLVDLVAPFGGAEEVMKDLKRTVFEGKTVKSRQVAPDGTGTAVVEW